METKKSSFLGIEFEDNNILYTLKTWPGIDGIDSIIKSTHGSHYPIRVLRICFPELSIELINKYGSIISIFYSPQEYTWIMSCPTYNKPATVTVYGSVLNAVIYEFSIGINSPFINQPDTERFNQIIVDSKKFKKQDEMMESIINKLKSSGFESKETEWNYILDAINTLLYNPPSDWLPSGGKFFQDHIAGYTEGTLDPSGYKNIPGRI